MFGQNNDNDYNYDPRINLMLIRNGKPSLIKYVKIKQGLSLQDIQKEIQKTFDFKTWKTVRIFKNEGVELESDDIPYIHDKEMLYISKGENFDASSNFAIYDLLEVIGKGGYGQVYYGINKLTDKPVAIKMMVSKPMKNTEQIQKVYKEIEALKQLDHRHILKVENGFFLKEQQSFAIVLEYLKGGDLKQYLLEQSKQRLTEEKAQHIFRQLVVGMQYCHSQNIIHRDLKLENLMFSDEEKTHLKIVDFGIVGIDSQHLYEATNAGSLRYLAPEVITSRARANPSIDVWGIGVILFYLLTGKPPFDGNSQQEIQDKIVKANFSFSNLLNFNENEISYLCKDLIQKILVVDVSKRLHINEIRQHPWVQREISDIWNEQKKQEEIQKIEQEKLKQKKIIEEENLKQIKRQSKYLKNKKHNYNTVKPFQNENKNNNILNLINLKQKVGKNSIIRTVNSQRYQMNQNSNNNFLSPVVQKDQQLKKNTRYSYVDIPRIGQNKIKLASMDNMNKSSYQQKTYTQNDNQDLQPIQYLDFKTKVTQKDSINDQKQKIKLLNQQKNTLNIPNFSKIQNESVEKKQTKSIYVLPTDTQNTHDNSVTPNNKVDQNRQQKQTLQDMNPNKVNNSIHHQQDNTNRHSLQLMVNKQEKNINVKLSYPKIQVNLNNNNNQHNSSNQSINQKSLKTPQRKLYQSQQHQKFTFNNIKKNFTAKEKMSQEYFQYLWDCKLKEEIQKQQQKLIEKQKQLEIESQKLQNQKRQAIQKSPINKNTIRTSIVSLYNKENSNQQSNTNIKPNNFTEMEKAVNKSKDDINEYIIQRSPQNYHLQSNQNSPKSQIKYYKL